jgi:hypothetical protein
MRGMQWLTRNAVGTLDECTSGFNHESRLLGLVVPEALELSGRCDCLA